MTTSDENWEVDRAAGNVDGCDSRAAQRPRQSGSSWPPMPTAARSSATCTTACSSTWSRSRSTCSSPARLVDADPAAAKALLDEMERDVQQALDETAQLAQRIYPPLLDAGGLAAALRAAAVSAGVRPRSRSRRARAIRPRSRATVYFCCLEALEHAGAGATVTVDRARRGGSGRLRGRRGRAPAPMRSSSGCATASRRSAAG